MEGSAVFVTLDLLLKVLIGIGHRVMLGPLDRAAAHRLTALAIPLSLAFLIGWIAGSGPDAHALDVAVSSRPVRSAESER